MTGEVLKAGVRLRENLIDLEFLMRDSGLWQAAPPSEWAFASELPFFHDRMSFPEWLQFVFIPNLQSLAENQAPWPEDCAVAPMADYYFGTQEIAAERLVTQVNRIDELVSEYQHSDETLSLNQTE